jgi:dCTP deaminase
MSILVDRNIFHEFGIKKIGITPFDFDNLGPASYDFHLHEDILIPTIGDNKFIIVDPGETDGKDYWEHRTLPRVLMPGDCILARSVEVFSFPLDVVGRVEGVSTNGRWFIQVHITAGFFDPGWPEGTVTLEIKNQGPFRVRLKPGMRIGQMAFERTESPSEQTYASRKHRYQGQIEPTASRPDPTGVIRAGTDQRGNELGAAGNTGSVQRHDEVHPGSIRTV